MNNHLFITFEGCEGSGKTTVIEEIKKLLIKDMELNLDYNKVIVTREPGGVLISESIRHIILDNNNLSMDGRTEALLYAASRRQHLVEKIIPALKKNKLVLSDRYVDSSLAYQGKARKIGITKVMELNKFATDLLLPSITIYLDIEPEIGLTRISNRNTINNRLDNEKIEFHKQVREGYLELLDLFPNRIHKVDASLKLNLVIKKVFTILKEHIKNEK